MDLAMPLAVVTPTLDAAVLHALAATTARASGAQVHRMAGTGSPDGVRKVLTRLVAQGIVLADEYPNATLYLLNRDHVAAEAIVALTDCAPRSSSASPTRCRAGRPSLCMPASSAPSHAERPWRAATSTSWS